MKGDYRNHAGILTLALLIALDVLAISIAFVDHPGLPISSISNLALDAFGMIICTILFASTLIDQRLSLSTIIFMCILAIETLLLFWDIENWAVNGNVDMIRFTKIVNYYIFGLVLIIIVAYWMYVSELYRRHRSHLRYLGYAVYVFFAVGMVLIVTNPFTELYFTIDPSTGLYERADTFWISYIAPMLTMAVIIYTVLKFEKNIRRKAVLLCYIFIPIVFAVIQLFWYGISLQYVSMMFAIIMMYANIYNQRSTELIRNEARFTRQRAEVMVSQIQPHFLYNALTSIMNIKGNPMETRDAIADFGHYLRGNLDSLSKTNAIPITKEMDQVEIYLALRKLRFGDRIKVDLDITDRGFFVPPYSIKTIIDALLNAHADDDSSIEVSIRTESNEDAHIIVIDDSNPAPASQEFIRNKTDKKVMLLMDRLSRMVNGTLSNIIDDNGHIVCTIRIPRRSIQ